jgi:hypothetical protein
VRRIAECELLSAEQNSSEAGGDKDCQARQADQVRRQPISPHSLFTRWRNLFVSMLITGGPAFRYSFLRPAMSTARLDDRFVASTQIQPACDRTWLSGWSIRHALIWDTTPETGVRRRPKRAPWVARPVIEFHCDPVASSLRPSVAQ